MLRPFPEIVAEARQQLRCVDAETAITEFKENDGTILDVREPIELAVENVPEAVNIPIGQLRARLSELPRDREIHVICRSGQRAYLATRILLQNGFKAKNVSGGMLSFAHNYLLDTM